nr:uncharacterized protein LOC107438467 [Parasteatoda tepidariorum]
MWKEIFVLVAIVSVVYSEKCEKDICSRVRCQNPVCKDGEVIKEKGGYCGCCDSCVPKEDCVKVYIFGRPTYYCFNKPTTTPKPDCIKINIMGFPTCIDLNKSTTTPKPEYTKKKRHSHKCPGS